MFPAETNSGQETTESTESCTVYLETKIRTDGSQLIAFKN